MKPIFENENFIAVDKPAGWLTTPSRMGGEDARPCLGKRLQDQLKSQIYPVHRLDLEVSGVVLFAKNPLAHKKANAWFEGHQVQKTYEAWSTGPVPSQKKGRVEMKLIRGKKRAYENPEGKEAITLFEHLGQGVWNQIPIQKWILMPMTGRSHQLRVALKSLSNPILGDELYESPHKFIESAIALRAIELSFKNCPEAAALGLPTLIEAPRFSSSMDKLEA